MLKDYDGWVNLAHAIIVQASQDYKHRYRYILQGKRENMKPLENFFRSDWFVMLSGGADPEYIMRKLRREVERDYAAERRKLFQHRG